jgi:hypothetical protein
VVRKFTDAEQAREFIATENAYPPRLHLHRGADIVEGVMEQGTRVFITATSLNLVQSTINNSLGHRFFSL